MLQSIRPRLINDQKLFSFEVFLDFKKEVVFRRGKSAELAACFRNTN
jgi:hypothetical protein